MNKLPIDRAQQLLITEILRGNYAIGSKLPGERKLSEQLGVTRSTLREVLRRMETDGWLTIQQGKSTTINDYLYDGGLNVLNDIVKYSPELPLDLVSHLLQVRRDLAASYTGLALTNTPEMIINYLQERPAPDENAQVYAHYDWQLHRTLTRASQNPIYSLIINGFADFYVLLAEQYYFTLAEARQTSSAYYTDLLHHAETGNIAAATALTDQIMTLSIDLWHAANTSD